MARVLDFTSQNRSISVEVDSSPAYELLVTLYALVEEDNWEFCDLGRPWFENLRKRTPKALLGEIEGFATAYGKLCCFPAAIVAATPPPRTVDGFLRALDEAGPSEVYQLLLGRHLQAAARPASAAVIQAAAEGGAPERATLAEAILADDPEAAAALRRLALMPPAEVQSRFIDLVRGFYEQVFREMEDEVTPILTRDATARRSQVRSLSVERGVEVATNGIQYAPEPGIRRILIVPHLAMRPWVMISEYDDLKVFLCPVAAESLGEDRDTPPQRLLALCKALAEEQRLRILRRLAANPMSLQQVADHLGIAKSTAHHHLVALRAAGLVRVTLGQDKEYSLREGLVPDVAGLLDAYLRGSAAPGREAS